MIESKFFHLFITTVWMSGLFGIVLTLAFLLHARHRYGPDAVAWNMPRTQTSLFASLATFSLGLALQSYVKEGDITLWVALVWAGLTFLFTIRTISALFAGFRYGWEFGREPSLYNGGLSAPGNQSGWITAGSIFAILLLLTNVGLFAWWGWGSSLGWRWPSVPSNISLFGLTLCVVSDEEGEGTPVALVTPTALITSTALVTPTALITPATPATPADTTAVAQDPNQEVVAPPEQPANRDSTTDNATVIETPAPEPTEAPISVSATPSATTEVISSPIQAIPLPLPPLPSPVPAVLPTSRQATAVERTLIVRSPRGARVRSGPDLTAEILTVLADGTRLRVLGRIADSQWFMVQVNSDLTGWMSTLVVDIIGTAEDIPVVEYHQEKGF